MVKMKREYRISRMVNGDREIRRQRVSALV